MSQFTQSELRDELRGAKVEPLLPIEKKLIGWSLGIGVVLLVVLAVANHLFPIAPYRSGRNKTAAAAPQRLTDKSPLRKTY
jgi:hypothetical protein